MKLISSYRLHGSQFRLSVLHLFLFIGLLFFNSCDKFEYSPYNDNRTGLVETNLNRKNIEKLPDIPDHYDEHFFEEIKEFLPHLKRVRFMGGEPFLIKQ